MAFFNRLISGSLTAVTLFAFVAGGIITDILRTVLKPIVLFFCKSARTPGITAYRTGLGPGDEWRDAPTEPPPPPPPPPYRPYTDDFAMERADRRRQATPNFQMREQELQQRIREQAIAAANPQPVSDQVVYTLPNIRLPRAHKAAFGHAALFEQQRNMLTHDAGLQLVLNALHTVINQILHTTIPLDEFTFVMNFSGAASPTSKHYVVLMTSPIVGKAELIQSVQPDMSIRWSLLYNGSLTIFTPAGRTEFDIQSVTVPSPELTKIVAGSEYGNREGRVIDLD